MFCFGDSRESFFVNDAPCPVLILRSPAMFLIE